MCAAGKASLVRSLQAQGEVVLLVGDGVNDAPALAAADVGVAMRGGTGSAMDAADVVLMRDDVRGAGMVVDASKLTLRKVTSREVAKFWRWPQGANRHLSILLHPIRCQRPPIFYPPCTLDRFLPLCIGCAVR